MAKEIRLLRADEIEVRVGTARSGSTGASFLLYKDARVDMSILDETYGADNWQREHKELKGVIYCGVGIYFEGRGWVTKWDAGAESNTEKEKGESSDSFKRACVNWGIGRELYTSPFIWVQGNPDQLKYEKLYVQEIGYNDKREISKLVICSQKTKQVVYTYNAPQSAQKSTPKSTAQPLQPTSIKMPEKTKSEIVLEYLRANEKARDWAFGIYPQFDTLDDFTEGALIALHAILKKNNKIA